MANTKSTVATQDFFQELMDDLNSMSTITSVEVLPTKGLLDNIPNGEVTLRMMTTHEEKIRTGSKGSFWKVMSSIINKCIVEPEGIDAYKLTVIDFVFLMYRLRRLSLGKDYRVSLTTCPSCDKPLSDVVVDLDKLSVKYIDENFKEPFEVKLPKLKWTVGCRLLRVNEFDEILTKSNKILEEFPSYEGDPTVSLRLIKQIVTINDKPVTQVQLEQIVDKLPIEDEVAISRAFESIDMGLDLNASYTCPRCGDELLIPLTYTEEFFRPTSD